MVNIKVAIRIRPLSEREIIQKDIIVVQRRDKSVLVTNPKISERQDGDSRQRTRRFVADFCYDPNTSNQESVYKEIGLEVLRSMFNGYNACVFAYGHSASGKTYTMMGLQNDPGLTPRISQGLFERIELKTAKDIRFNVFVSFLEIYNEKVRDLLACEEASTANFSLRVREHPKLGPYVQGLSQHAVTDENKLLEFLEIGCRRRSTAATENNVHSSRSHAVFTILFKQTDEENYETDKSSKVHLVDLAGSERASSTQSKTRLKEGANINKSLVTLGNVISALAESFETSLFLKENSGCRTWHPFVPYRDSVLTWLLKDTLGGNSNTIMIATISPASGCLSETINTLRYARRTQRIVNQAIINEDPKIRTIKQLREEVIRLRRLLFTFQPCLETSLSKKELLETNESQFQELESFESTISKWLDSGGMRLTGFQENHFKQENIQKSVDEEQDLSWKKNEKIQKPSNEIEVIREEGAEGREISHTFSGLPRADSFDGDACKINDGKKSDVNGSVIDNFLHETEFFSDSLESFSSFSLNNNNSKETKNVDVKQRYVDVEKEKKRSVHLCKASKVDTSPTKKFKLSLKREFNSCENLAKVESPEMLRKSRPDLIKGISTRSKECFQSASSQSCTDASNLSQSNSENSLNSSGSIDTQTYESRSSRVVKPSISQGEKQITDDRRCNIQIENRKKGKRSEIVKAVTSRLYVAKKNTNTKEKPAEKDCDDDDEELDELKLCKRARMKLFDLSRKLAMTRKLKKTMDNDTQTDFQTGTVRMKEKSVLTDEIGPINTENSETNTNAKDLCDEKNKPYVIMNQVFIPYSSNYVVECGKLVRVEVPEALDRHELGTQTYSEAKNFKNVNTSPIKFISGDEDLFSEDSLDWEEDSNNQEPNEKNKEIGKESKLKSQSLNMNLTSRSYDSLVSATSENKEASNLEQKYHSYECLSSDKNVNKLKSTKLSKEIEKALMKNVSSVVFPESPSTELSESSNLNDLKKENLSSENSFTSMDSIDVASSSETSSEDFVFYESPKDKEIMNRTLTSSDRELYTITENSEQSEASDTLSPVRSLNVLGETKEDLTQKQIDKREETESKDTNKKCCECEEKNLTSTSNKRTITINSNTNFVQTEEKPFAKTSDQAINTLMETFESLMNVYINKSKKVPNSQSFTQNTAKVTLSTDVSTDTLLDAMSYTNKPPENNTSTKDSTNQSFPKKINWSDLQLNPQTQYLNLNILDSSKSSTFSVDTNLFAKPHKKDQSTETIFTSQDSVTLVFMGPAQPESSVLLEIIKRSLNKGSFTIDASQQTSQSRNKGVQCDSKLMRSVSVDTAFLALSRIARNQDSLPKVFRTKSLGDWVVQEGTPPEAENSTGFRETGCQCNLSNDFSNSEGKKSVLKYSVCTGTTSDQQIETINIENKKREDVEKPKKSVSWFGEVNGEVKKGSMKEIKQGKQEDSDTSCLDLNYCEVEVKEPNYEDCEEYSFPESNLESCSQSRKVRFSNEGFVVNSQKKETLPSASSVSSFLEEATQLLRNFNYFSSNHDVYFNERLNISHFPNEESSYKAKPKRNWNNVSLITGNSENVLGRNSKTPISYGESKSSKVCQNSTWPRWRPAHGKPPSGRSSESTKSTRPSLPVSYNSTCSNGFSDIAKNCSRMGSSSTDWNISNLSTTFSNSYAGESPSGGSSCRSVYSMELKSLKNYTFRASPRAVSSKPNFNSLLDLETNLEESCHRLEQAAEQDRIRQEKLDSRLASKYKYEKFALENFSSTECTESNLDSFISSSDSSEYSEEKKFNILERRKTDRCAGGCICKTQNVRRNPCKFLLLKTSRSVFGLDTYGPGSNHCHQYCMFCQKKDSEIYSSTPSLNSKCDLGRCRLNFYGYCPCSPVRLRHITPSPRAYMQHLLNLRRQVVNATKH